MRRYLPKFNTKPASLFLKEGISILEIIDLSRQKTVCVWQPEIRKHRPTYLLPDCSLVTATYESVTRMDACSNIVWRKRLSAHHTMERDADGHFWMPAFAR